LLVTLCSPFYTIGDEVKEMINEPVVKPHPAFKCHDPDLFRRQALQAGYARALAWTSTNCFVGWTAEGYIHFNTQVQKVSSAWFAALPTDKQHQYVQLLRKELQERFYDIGKPLGAAVTMLICWND
jgi:hypothetical protein